MNGFLITAFYSCAVGIALFIGAYFYSDKCDNHDPGPLLVAGFAIVAFAVCTISLIIGTLQWCLS